MQGACPCGSGRPLDRCCGPLLDGVPASTCEQLMRSRYTAYVLGRHDYILATWHPENRPAAEALGGTSLNWIGLRIVATERGGEGDGTGTVSFIASYVAGGRGRQLHETSRFVRLGGRWHYVDGDCTVSDIGRNDPCPCGSGNKFKRCCGAARR